ncbi:MAG TPA: VWA domain-containing protein [Candidatus Dormibacteraeota bacterium]
MTEPAVRAAAAVLADALVLRVVTFGRLLRKAGINPGQDGTVDAIRSLAVIDPTDPEQFYQAMQSNFVSSPDDLARFDELYFRFWRRPQEAGSEPPDRPNPLSIDLLQGGEARIPDPDSAPEGEETEDGLRAAAEEEAAEDQALSAGATERHELSELLEDESEGEDASEQEAIKAAYSPLEHLATKDFARMSPAELRQIRRLVRKLKPRLLILQTRRFRKAHGRADRLDFRRSIRQSLSKGDLIDLAWRKPRVARARVLLLCDVSRSMEKYSELLIHFIYVLASQVAGTEAFTFSTRLTRITPQLRARSVDQVLAQLPETEAAWSSGTTIGRCLMEFNRNWGERLVDGRTITIVLSDGWDRGDVSVLREEVARLKRRSRTLIWLNPMMSDRQYLPLCSGMRAAMPSIDFLLPCHNLASLEAFAERLSKI